jgi:HprK-related kinase A
VNLRELAPGRSGTAARCGIYYQTGPFCIALRTEIPPLIELLEAFYGDVWASTEPVVTHFTVRLRHPPGIRRWLRPQVIFQLDDIHPFEPFPLAQAFPLLEWGLNWSIGTRAHQFLMLHAAALERNGEALVLPAMPGSGKSTLSAALAYRGWRFLSDEFGLIRPETVDILPIPRAVPLKNRSIPVIREYLPQAYLGPVFTKTRKGDVAHLRPPRESILRQCESARPRWIVFPRFTSGMQHAHLIPLEKSLGFTRLAQNAFNYQLLGEAGFHTLVRMVRVCDCYRLDYGDLDSAVSALDRLCSDEKH